MNLAQVIGYTTATVKHPSLEGLRLLIVQPLDIQNSADGEPLIAIDRLGGRRGDHVLLTSDSKMIAQMLKREDSPIRWAVLGIAD